MTIHRNFSLTVSCNSCSDRATAGDDDNVCSELEATLHWGAQGWTRGAQHWQHYCPKCSAKILPALTVS